MNTTRPRVLMLYDFPLHGGGSGAYIKYLSLRLVKAYGYQVGIALPDTESIGGNVKLFPMHPPQIPVFVGRPGLEHSKKYTELTPDEIGRLYYSYIAETMKIVEEFKPDIIHVHHTMINAWAARYIRSIYGTKIIITSHGSDLHVIAKDKRYLRMTRDALRAANAVTVVSGDTRAKLLKMFGTDLSAKTRTITGGIRLSLFPLTMDIQHLRDKYHLLDQKVALFTGRLISEKGVAYLVKAANKIQGTVIIAGDGPQRVHLEEIITERKLSNVKLLPFVKKYTEFLELYYLATVFVSPALWDEPLGLTIIEAMASQTPVIVTRKGGVTMAVKDGLNGLFVRPRNSTEIASAVNRLFENTQLAQKMGSVARKTVEARFTWTKIAERFDNLYRSI